MLVMGDALAMAVLQARGFKQQDFARLPSLRRDRPGHAPRAWRDIMRTGPPQRRGRRRICRSRSAAGDDPGQDPASLSVVNARGKLVGVFTDGDFRRHMAADGDLLRATAQEVMTRKPIRIREKALGGGSAQSFQRAQHRRSDRGERRNEPVGLVDSQDLPKLKLM